MDLYQVLVRHNPLTKDRFEIVPFMQFWTQVLPVHKKRGPSKDIVGMNAHARRQR